MQLFRGVAAGAIAAASVLSVAPLASAATLRITVSNLAPENGNFLTPAWFGLHDGSFDLYNRNEPITAGLERLVEDGDIPPLNAEFSAAGGGTVQGAVLGLEGTAPGPIDPGEVASILVEDVDASAESSRYFSYASMVIPSNDFFIANGDPLAHQIFDDSGNFLGADFIVAGSNVLDGGTEVNDELPETTAFLGQTVADTGEVEGGGVTLAQGYIPGGNVLSSDDFFNADFTAPGYEVARFQVELVEDDAASVPEPGSVLALMAVGSFLVSRKLKQA
ncbi:MAG: spondin domain-containing protein [Cyanobacteria bacterium J06627_32]